MQIPWTDGMVSTLRDMAANHSSAREIASALGVTRNAVCGKAFRIGLNLTGQARSGGYRSRGGRPRLQKLTAMILNLPRVSREALNQVVDPKEIPVDSFNLTFADLTIGQCKYPTTTGLPHLFCGHEQQEGSSYCPHHHAVTHEVPRGRSDRRRKPFLYQKQRAA